MRKRNTIFWSVLAAALIFGASNLAAGQGQQQQKPPTPPPGQGQQGQQGQPTTPAQPPVNKDEEDAYKKFFDAHATKDTQITLGEDFLKKFPDSHYKESVYSVLTSDYMLAGQADKMMAAGEKTLEIDPDNVDVLAVLALAIPRRVDPSKLDAEQKLVKAETYAKKGIALISVLPKPAGISDDDFQKAKNGKLSMCHSGLGVAYFQRGKYLESAAELTEAIKLESDPDQVDYYVLGLAYNNAKKPDDAVAAFGKCAEIQGQLQAECKKNQDAVKKTVASQPKP